ncbi:hypothetical protein D3C87_1235340 [compost metagenome]
MGRAQAEAADQFGGATPVILVNQQRHQILRGQGVGLPELHGGEEFESGVFHPQLVEVHHAQVIADFFVGGGQSRGPLQVRLRQAVVAPGGGELAQAVFGFGGQAAAEQAAVQWLGFAAAEQSVDLGFAQAHVGEVVRQALQVGQAGVQFAVLGHVIGQVQRQLLIGAQLAATGGIGQRAPGCLAGACATAEQQQTQTGNHCFHHDPSTKQKPGPGR